MGIQRKSQTRGYSNGIRQKMKRKAIVREFEKKTRTEDHIKQIRRKKQT